MDVFGIAASGMAAAQTQLGVAANNIANANTAGFKASRVNLTTAPDDSGVAVGSISQDPSPGTVDSSGQEASNVNLANEMVAMNSAKTLYGANAKVAWVADQMMGSLLDMFDTNPADGRKRPP